LTIFGVHPVLKNEEISETIESVGKLEKLQNFWGTGKEGLVYCVFRTKIERGRTEITEEKICVWK
jgi:hypothetical protein